jgi:hypothetical protein
MTAQKGGGERVAATASLRSILVRPWRLLSSALASARRLHDFDVAGADGRSRLDDAKTDWYSTIA